MWPERGEALTRTIECEAALTEVYASALNTWVTETRPFIIPTVEGMVVNGDPVLVAAGSPPNPDGVSETSGAWDQLSAELILACLSSLWALSVVEASEGLEIELPELDGESNSVDISVEVINAITSTSEVAEDELVAAVTRIEGNPYLREARDDYVNSQRPTVAGTPAMIRDRVAAAVRDAGEASVANGEPDITVVITRQREAAAAVMSPGSEATRVVARMQGYQAASVQNAAVVSAAHRSEDVAILEKTWIATLDGKTRHTHFAADGQRAPLSGKFQVGSAQLDFPADPGGPPEEVKNCRCRVGILAKDEALPDEVDRHTERLNGRDSVAINRNGRSQAEEIERRERQGTVRAREDEDGIGRTASAAPSEENTMTEYVTFTDQPLAFVGIESSDGRMIAEDVELTVRTPPLPVMYCEQTNYGHMDAWTVGVTESARLDGDRIVGSGYMLDDEHASKAFDHAARKVSRPSVDLAATEWKLMIKEDDSYREITEDDWWDLPMDAHIVQCITKAELIGFTLVATPAFGETMLEFNDATEERELGLVASAAEEFRPRVYPTDMFVRTPEQYLTEATEIQMDTATGRIFGHLACFGSCHRSIQAQCVMAPKSPSNYSQFHTSPSVRLDDGSRLAVGRLTVGTGHADDRLGGAAAMAHYDNTGSCFALVRAYETPIGVEVSGVAAPWATAEQIEMGLAAPLSGDWRDFGQGLDLIAALAVNTPGFAVRGRTDAEGRNVALVASLAPRPTGRNGTSGQALSAETISAVVAAAVTKALTDRDDAAELDRLMAEADDLLGPLPEPKTADDEIDAILAKVSN